MSALCARQGGGPRPPSFGFTTLEPLWVFGAREELWLVKPLEGWGALTSPTEKTAVALPSAPFWELADP